MPIYEYRCPNGHEFEVFQSMSEAPLAQCRECGAPVERVFHPVAVHFKGKGFYTTDYARGAPASDGAPSTENKKESEKKDSGKESSKQGAEGKASGGEKSKAGSGGG